MRFLIKTCKPIRSLHASFMDVKCLSKGHIYIYIFTSLNNLSLTKSSWLHQRSKPPDLCVIWHYITHFYTTVMCKPEAGYTAHTYFWWCNGRRPDKCLHRSLYLVNSRIIHTDEMYTLNWCITVKQGLWSVILCSNDWLLLWCYVSIISCYIVYFLVKILWWLLKSYLCLNLYTCIA